MKISNRTLHRDIAYFYVGLIIAFSFSGIILNHRKDWYPMDYTYQDKQVEVKLPSDEKMITKEFVEGFSKNWEVTYEDHRIRDNELLVYYKDNKTLDIDMATGKGNLEFKRRTPIVGDSMLLHKSTDKFWIWYSDIFGAAMLIIAITGMLIPAGKNGFKKRGWKLALLGMLFPLIFLIFLS